MELRLLFFGPLAEIAGKSEIIIKNRDISDIKGLTVYINQRFPQMAEFNYQVSVNKNIVRENFKLTDKDEVALLPPFAGG